MAKFTFTKLIAALKEEPSREEVSIALNRLAHRSISRKDRGAVNRFIELNQKCILSNGKKRKIVSMLHTYKKASTHNTIEEAIVEADKKRKEWEEEFEGLKAEFQKLVLTCVSARIPVGLSLTRSAYPPGFKEVMEGTLSHSNIPSREEYDFFMSNESVKKIKRLYDKEPRFPYGAVILISPKGRISRSISNMVARVDSFHGEVTKPAYSGWNDSLLADVSSRLKTTMSDKKYTEALKTVIEAQYPCVVVQNKAFMPNEDTEGAMPLLAWAPGTNFVFLVPERDCKAFDKGNLSKRLVKSILYMDTHRDAFLEEVKKEDDSKD